MYIHLGENTVINTADIVAIIDLDNTTVSKTTRDFLTKMEKEGKVVNVTEELPRSGVICNKNGKETVYISQISPQTLQKRFESEKIIYNSIG
ncbi:MAG: DUF370 domain-containing protein [Clostridia bacterium]|nr:DUF370 domain-containing protein [Clostridia bacterium]MBQ4542772.1 DUF370 domain-containing protein [Clostridia bacterium]MBQ9997385.1 DUF370 domain-containing protein [Clostridia bacterium]